MSLTAALELENVSKCFVLHLRDGLKLPVISRASLTVSRGECVVLSGPSGAGKSSILRMIYGNYRTDSGHIRAHSEIGPVDITTAEPRAILALRRATIGYVSQFLRVIPRVPTIDIVANAATVQGVAASVARERAAELLTQLNVPERLWQVPPATFSGGEQQRVNIARGFIAQHRILLLDEPTASLDAANRSVVVDLIVRRKQTGVAILGIFHDDVRARVADRFVDVTRFAALETNGEHHVA